MLLSWRGDIVPCDSAPSACGFSFCSSLLDQLMFPIICLISRDAHGKLKKFVQSQQVSFKTARLYKIYISFVRNQKNLQLLKSKPTVQKMWCCSLAIPLLTSCHLKSLNLLHWHFGKSFGSVLSHGYSKTMVQGPKPHDFLSPNLTWVMCPPMLPCNKPVTFPRCVYFFEGWFSWTWKWANLNYLQLLDLCHLGTLGMQNYGGCALLRGSWQSLRNYVMLPVCQYGPKYPNASSTVLKRCHEEGKQCPTLF